MHCILYGTLPAIRDTARVVRLDIALVHVSSPMFFLKDPSSAEIFKVLFTLKLKHRCHVCIICRVMSASWLKSHRQVYQAALKFVLNAVIILHYVWHSV